MDKMSEHAVSTKGSGFWNQESLLKHSCGQTDAVHDSERPCNGLSGGVAVEVGRGLGNQLLEYWMSTASSLFGSNN